MPCLGGGRRPSADQLVQRRCDLNRRGRAGGVVVGRGLGMAKMREDHNLLIGLAGDEGGDHFEGSVAEGAHDVGPHLRRRVAAQFTALARGQHESEAFRVVFAPPK